jgi:hypothetical protein
MGQGNGGEDEDGAVGILHLEHRVGILGGLLAEGAERVGRAEPRSGEDRRRSS